MDKYRHTFLGLIGKEILKVLCCGFVVADLIVADLPYIPRPSYITWAPMGIRLRTGGHPTNVSIDLMQMGLSEGDVGVVGVVGYDVFGDFIESSLRSKGIRTLLSRVKEAETSKCIALVVKGEDRRFIAEPGANEYLRVEDVEKMIFDHRPTIFYQASGILGEYDFKLPHVLNVAKSINSITILDFVQPYRKSWGYLIPALPFTDIIHCNDVELRQMTNYESIEDGVKKIADLGVKISLISLGSRGLYAYLRKSDILIKQDAFKVDVVDPTGAGDALVAGVMYSLLSKINHLNDLDDIEVDDLIEILAYGQAAGAACVTGIGATAGVTKNKIEDILRLQGDMIIKNTKVKKLSK
ncbi:MAG: carbohydrate kinase family protein [Nitrososphaerota archaeon]